MLEPPKFTRMAELLVLKKLCFVMQIAIDVAYCLEAMTSASTCMTKASY